jgi:hypothetical protein
MKKLVITLFVLGFAVTAFAQEVKKDLPLTVGASGIAYSTSYKAVDKDAEGDYTAFRVRPLFTFTNGDFEAVVKLEYDATFGVETDSDGKDAENVGYGADKKGLEVANAYVKTKVDAVAGLTLLGGIAYYDFPLVYGDNTPLASVNYSNDMMNLGLYYAKPSEGDNNNAKDDSQIYIADLAVKFGESTIRPAFFAYQCKEAAVVGQYKDSIGYIGALALNLAVGTFGIDASGAYVSGENKVTETDYSAFAFDVAPYIKLDPFKVTAFFTYVSGDDGSKADEDNSFLNATLDGGSAGVNSYRLYIIEDAGSFTTNSDVANAGKYGNTFGYIAYGLSVDGTFGPITCKLIGAYVQAAEAPSGVKSDMGIEVDANIGYALTKSSTLFVEGAYLKTGKFYESVAFDPTTGAIPNASGKKQNAQYLSLGVSYSL